MSLHQGNPTLMRNSSTWARSAVASMKQKAEAIAAAVEELHTSLERFDERGGFQEITDANGAPYERVSDFLTSELGLAEGFHRFLLDE